jgi:hypothetical protein
MTEKTEIKRDGAKAQKNSGRGMYQKGDALLSIFTIDYKEYPKGYRVDKAAWAKICSDAWRNGGMEPMIKIVLGEGNNRTRLCVVSENIMQDYIRLLTEEKERLGYE